MSWSNVEKDVESGPFGLWKWVLMGVVGIIAIGVITSVIGRCASVAGEAADVAQKEFGPKALLAKYEWFKDASAQLDKKKADILVQQDAVDRAAKRSKDRFSEDNLSIKESDLAGIKMSYNSLAAEYNAQMVKFNYRFTNVGDLPAGATEALPREVKPYVEK